MNKKFIIAGAMLFSVAALIVVLYITSAVMHKIPTRTALLIGTVFSISDTAAAIFILTRPDKP